MTSAGEIYDYYSASDLQYPGSLLALGHQLLMNFPLSKDDRPVNSQI